jgi:hypothetical protein
MTETKWTTAWADASLACGVLGWLAAVPLPLIDYQHIGGATAGVGVLGPFLLGVLSALLGVLGLILGMVALARGSGRGKAWAGIALAGLLLTGYAAAARLLFAWW